MAGELVLITGSNGAIGYEVVLRALRAGYKVRAVVRSQEKADLVANGPSIKALDAETKGHLSFAIVPDLLKPDAYDEALKDIVYVIHVASPIPVGKTKSYEDDMIKPAVQGTMNMIEAAEKVPSVKRVVITSSVVGQVPFSIVTSGNIPDVYDEKTRMPDPTGPYKLEAEAYYASKAIALNAAEKWKAEKHRRVELVHVHPSNTLGRIELARNVDDIIASSSGRAILQITGKETNPKHISNTCWIDDVAEVHVRALYDHVPDGQSLVIVGGTPDGAVWADGKSVLQNRFPKAVAKGALPNNGWVETVPWRYDVSVTEKLVGMKFAGFEKQIGEVAEQYLELIGEEKA